MLSKSKFAVAGINEKTPAVYCEGFWYSFDETYPRSVFATTLTITIITFAMMLEQVIGYLINFNKSSLPIEISR